MDTKNLNILLADDHSMFLDVLKHIIQSKFNDSTIFTVGSYNELDDAFSSGANFDLVLMDYRMPGFSGIDNIKKLLSRYPDTDFIIVSGTANYSEIDEFLNLGIKGYVPKTASSSIIVSAINIVLEGEIYIPISLYQHSKSNPNRDLSSKELAILQKLRLGYSNKQIAQALGIEEVTVKMYLTRLTKKFNARNRTHLVVEAINNNVID